MGTIGVLVTSCESFAPATLPRLLESLQRAGVPPDAVRVVIGDCEVDEDGEPLGGVRVHRRRTAMLDNNGLAWLAEDESWRVDWVAYLHDTCTVHPRFWTECDRVVQGLDDGIACAKLRAANSMGMGLYRAAWVRSPPASSLLRAMHTEDLEGRAALKQRLDELEDTLFKLAESHGHGVVALQPDCEVHGQAVMEFGTQTKRRLEFYPVPGVYKLKANWGGDTLLKLRL